MNTKTQLAVIVLLTSGIVALAQTNPPAKKETSQAAKSAADSVPASEQRPSDDGAAAVRSEIRVALDRYREAMLARDYDAMLSFWSESPDFVFAGDGRILGGFEAWKVETTRHFKETRKWEQWDWQSVHILPLSASAASATVEFRFRWIDLEGATRNMRGAWIYVFAKSNGVWKVVHTNGTHVVL